MYLGSMIVIVLQILTMEYGNRILQHTALFYLAMSIAVPAGADRSRRGVRKPLGCDHCRRDLHIFTAGLVWILPLFPAEPKLGPVFNPVTHFVPPQFPLLLIVPAFAIDLLRHYFDRRGINPWLQAVALGIVFWAYSSPCNGRSPIS